MRRAWLPVLPADRVEVVLRLRWFGVRPRVGFLMVTVAIESSSPSDLLPASLLDESCFTGINGADSSGATTDIKIFNFNFKSILLATLMGFLQFNFYLRFNVYFIFKKKTVLI